MKELRDAIIQAGKELEEEHAWSVFENEQGETFVNVLLKYVVPFTDYTMYRESRIAALKAELEALTDGTTAGSS